MHSALKGLLRFSLHRAGAIHPLLWRSRHQFRILTYHRFSPELYPAVQADLEQQCAFLKKNFEVVSMAEIGASLDASRKLPAKALAITVDDGYRDFWTDAFPVFQAWKIPVTVYLITDFLDGTLWPWWNQVEYAIENSPVHTLALPLSLEKHVTATLRTPAERTQATDEICSLLTQLPHTIRMEAVAKLPELLRVDIPASPPGRYLPLQWDQVRHMAKEGIEFGAHTRTHPVLPTLEDKELVYQEIAGSKARLDHELGEPTRHFCYPNGDLDETAVKAVQQCGFQTAVTTRAGLNGQAEHRHLLKRLSVEPGLGRYYFREQVAGLHS